MADLTYPKNFSELKKNSQILVIVDHVSDDVLVVTFNCDDKTYQGALLETSKRRVPCGVIIPPNTPVIGTEASGMTITEDKLLVVSQRHTYDQSYATSLGVKQRPITLLTRRINMPSRYRNNQLTVRLRPRKVLCSRCRSTCNENNENVDGRITRSKEEPTKEKEVNMSSPSSLVSSKKLCPSLIPKLQRLQPEEIENALNGGNISKVIKIEKNSDCPSSEKISKASETLDKIHSQVNKLDKNTECIVKYCDETKMVLRKKGSIGSLEDLWEEKELNVDRTIKNGLEKRSDNDNVTPVIKISFGKDTVMEIPSRSKLVSKNWSYQKKEVNIAAARKALKRAQRKLLLSGLKNQYRMMNKRHKHKKRHKNKRQDGFENDKNYSSIKEQCLRQRLSINLKRLNSNVFTSHSPVASSSNSEDGEFGLPDFPAPSSPSSGKITSTTWLPGENFANYCNLNAGDVVWGKIQGFPWWPGKVSKLCVDPKTGFPRAHVSWFGSSTQSYMSCDLLCPFLESYKAHFNKKKRGAYREAVRQATIEAQGHAGGSPSYELDQNSPSYETEQHGPPFLEHLTTNEDISI